MNKKIINALHFYIGKLRYRRTEGWSDSDPTNQHFINMINKYWRCRDGKDKFCRQ